jgi:hypothetical protein
MTNFKRITDPDFRYTPAASTDLRKTFARVRREQRREQERVAAPAANVATLRRKVTP